MTYTHRPADSYWSGGSIDYSQLPPGAIMDFSSPQSRQQPSYSEQQQALQAQARVRFIDQHAQPPLSPFEKGLILNQLGTDPMTSDEALAELINSYRAQFVPQFSQPQYEGGWSYREYRKQFAG
jgi:hypothetical protein